MKIPFTDLYQAYLECQIDIDHAIQHTIQSSSFITGPDVSRFEHTIATFVRAESCASTGSCTAALTCSLRAAGIGAGDEVLTTPHTFVATTGAICAVGAVPVFVDIDFRTHLMDLDLVEDLITPRTKAVLTVDIYGQCTDLTRLRSICDAHGLVMIQDSAHSFGGTWLDQPIGGQADYTCFSFNPVKNLGAMGDAGCVVGSTQNMDKVRVYRDHGRSGRYVFHTQGYNARIDNIQANIVLAKLPRLALWIQQRNNIAAMYELELGDLLRTVAAQPGAGHARHVCVVQTPDRDALREHLEHRGVSTNIHYATTTHTQPAFQHWYRPCPVAERTVQEILSLPCWPHMQPSQIQHVIMSIREFFL